MGKVNQLWMTELSEAEEDFQEGKINEEQFRARLERLGLPSWQTEDALTELTGA